MDEESNKIDKEVHQEMENKIIEENVKSSLIDLTNLYPSSCSRHCKLYKL